MDFYARIETAAYGRPVIEIHGLPDGRVRLTPLGVTLSKSEARDFAKVLTTAAELTDELPVNAPLGVTLSAELTDELPVNAPLGVTLSKSEARDFAKELTIAAGLTDELPVNSER